MAARVIARDWSTSALGTLEDWPLSLKTALAICLPSPVPMAIYWGREQVCLHNDAAAEAGIVSPDALGMPATDAPPEPWGVVGLGCVP